MHAGRHEQKTDGAQRPEESKEASSHAKEDPKEAEGGLPRERHAEEAEDDTRPGQTQTRTRLEVQVLQPIHHCDDGVQQHQGVVRAEVRRASPSSRKMHRVPRLHFPRIAPAKMAGQAKKMVLHPVRELGDGTGLGQVAGTMQKAPNMRVPTVSAQALDEVGRR